MPLFAKNGNQIESAAHADPQKTFQCLSCQGSLKVKKGLFRASHFYHLKQNFSCRSHGKSERHFHIQMAVQKRLPAEESFLEKSFPSIHRIADLAWEKKKIVFEVQCSRISCEEARSRINEYASIGYRVVWLLDDRLFNKKRASPSEIFLREGVCYFVHFEKNFYIYDQMEIFFMGKRKCKTNQVKIDISCPRSEEITFDEKWFPKQLYKRWESGHLFFERDLIAQALIQKIPFPQLIDRSHKTSLLTICKRAYASLFSQFMKWE